MKSLLLISALLYAVICSAQTERPKLKLTGETVADRHSHRMILTATFGRFREKDPTCGYLLAAHREIIEKSPDLERSEGGSVVRGYVREKWTVEACGVISTQEIKLTGVGNGTVWSTSSWSEVKSDAQPLAPGDAPQASRPWASR